MKTSCKRCGAEIDTDNPHVSVTNENNVTSFFCNEMHHLQKANETLAGYGARYLIAATRDTEEPDPLRKG